MNHCSDLACQTPAFREPETPNRSPRLQAKPMAHTSVLVHQRSNDVRNGLHVVLTCPTSVVTVPKFTLQRGRWQRKVSGEWSNQRQQEERASDRNGITAEILKAGGLVTAVLCSQSNLRDATEGNAKVPKTISGAACSTSQDEGTAFDLVPHELVIRCRSASQTSISTPVSTFFVCLHSSHHQNHQ